ncbi:thioesterase family protein [Nocardioides insulae]|uniref:thioesterase family protein n=1 Tax=Nocardioides insulae TaxID=394734 RepID=UPI0004043E2C|nr:thioesterase family protein [Nocardioides insulae]
MSGAQAPSRPALPTVAEIDALGNEVRLLAPPEWEDQNGHVNVCHYYNFHMQGAHRFFEELGVHGDYLATYGQSTFTMEQHINFYDEVLIGHEVSVHTRLLARNAKLLHAASIIVNRTTGRVVNTLEYVEGHVDLTTRRTVPWQQVLAEPIDALLAQHRALDWTLPPTGTMGLR